MVAFLQRRAAGQQRPPISFSRLMFLHAFELSTLEQRVLGSEALEIYLAH